MKTGPDFSEEHILSDGTMVTIRHIRPSDAEELRRGFHRLSRESRYRRFFGGISDLSDAMVRYLTTVDGRDHVALVALGVSPDLKSETGYGVARFVRKPEEPDVAEAAITVIDPMQHKGLGRILARALADAALERGVTHFRGEVLASNTPVRQLLTDAKARIRVESPASIVFDVALAPASQGDGEPGSRDSLHTIVRAAATSATAFLRSLALLPEPPHDE